MALADSLDRERDIIFSNHRCHGHYLAWTDDVEGLLAEVMGKESGVCGGIGGSQHLCGRRFFSNGIQGGIVPVSAGLAFAHKLARRMMESSRFASATARSARAPCTRRSTLRPSWRLPLLVMLENNLYAQCTSQGETLAGDICARAAAFGIDDVSRGYLGSRAARGDAVRAVARVQARLRAWLRAGRYLSLGGALQRR